MKPPSSSCPLQKKIHPPWSPFPHQPTLITFSFQCHDHIFRPAHQSPPLAFQFGSHITKKGHQHQRNSRSNGRARQLGRAGPRSFLLDKWRLQNGGPPAERSSSCSESHLFLASEVDLPLSECALYRQTEQERHFRWRGWMLRPRVIRSPTNPKWDRSRVRVPLRAACSFCFLFCRLSLFLSSSVSSPSGFCQFYYSLIRDVHPKSIGVGGEQKF